MRIFVYFAREYPWQSAIVLLCLVLAGLMEGVGDRLVKRLRKEGWYPSIDPPRLNQRGGLVEPGFGLQMTDPNGARTEYIFFGEGELFPGETGIFITGDVKMKQGRNSG